MGKKGKQSGKRAVPIPVKTVGPSQLEASDVDHIEVADDADKAQVVDRGAGEEGGKASAQGNSHPAAPARAEDGDARALREENDRLRAEVASKDARIAELVKQMDGLEQRVRQERERADGAAARVQELQPQASRAGDAGLGQGSDGIAVKDLKSDLQAVRERLALIKKEQAAAEERKRRAWDQLRTCVGELARMAGPAMG